MDELQTVAARICAARGFTLGSTLGHGAFKETYLANVGGQPFALKVVRANADPARIQREISAMRRCKHTNISVLQACDLEQVGGQTYCWLLEEYLGGGTLEQKRTSGVLSVSDVKHLGAVLIEALDHLRSLGLVHRDIKPENILYRADGKTPVLVDFGIARDLDQVSLTQTWAARGPATPFYAAPEQLHNRKDLIDWRTDQFSLGVTLAVCGFGRHPFAAVGEPPARTVQKVIEHLSATQDCATWAATARLPALMGMVKIWPAERYRTPALLRQAWNSSGG